MGLIDTAYKTLSRLFEPQKHTRSGTQQHTHTSKKHRHHDLPCLLASSGFNFTGEWDCRTTRDGAWSAQHGDAIFLCETNLSFILFTIIQCAAAWRARGQKVSFWSDYLPFFRGRCIETMRTDPSSIDICFVNASWVFIMFWHDFRWVGGGRHDHIIYLQRRGRLRHVANLLRVKA